MSTPGHHGKYVLTMGWPEKLKRLRTVSIKVPNSQNALFKETNEGIYERFSRCFGEEKILMIDAQDMAAEIIASAIAEKNRLKNAIIISACPEISSLSDISYKLEVNRITNPNTGKILGIGPRPGYTDVETQILEMKDRIGEKKVILVEDGGFTGMTLAYLIKEMKRHNIDIVSIVVGLLFPKAQKVLSGVFRGKVTVTNPIKNPIDWIPDHDLLPFTPNCGRVFGLMFKGNAIPMYSSKGMAFSAPYLLPFSPMRDWTSINTDKQAHEISVFCLRKCLEVFEEIDGLNKRKITLAEICGLDQAISVPMSFEDRRLPEPDMPVTDYFFMILHDHLQSSG